MAATLLAFRAVIKTIAVQMILGSHFQFLVKLARSFVGWICGILMITGGIEGISIPTWDPRQDIPPMISGGIPPGMDAG